MQPEFFIEVPLEVCHFAGRRNINLPLSGKVEIGAGLLFAGVLDIQVCLHGRGIAHRLEGQL